MLQAYGFIKVAYVADYGNSYIVVGHIVIKRRKNRRVQK
jgi:hypothetical protein